MWADRRILDLFGIELPIILAPMAGSVYSDMTIAVAEAGGLGSLPCATFTPEKARSELAIVRQATSKPVNLNFFCHKTPKTDIERESRWRKHLEPYYLEFDLDPHEPLPASGRAPFSAEFCDLVEEFRPEVVSFHFGLPERDLLDRVRATGAKIISTATSVKEALWLEERGCDAIIAQGAEAGGHSGMFLTSDIATQTGTFALVPQVADAVTVPVIAAGGITDGRGIVAALALGASAVQIGTAYLFSPQARIATLHRAALRNARNNPTAMTNVFTGRPARGMLNRVMREIGPMSDMTPEFPLAGGSMAPLRAKTEPEGSPDFMSLWAGQAASLGRELDAAELTRQLASDALAQIAAYRR